MRVLPGNAESPAYRACGATNGGTRPRHRLDRAYPDARLAHGRQHVNVRPGQPAARRSTPPASLTERADRRIPAAWRYRARARWEAGRGGPPLARPALPAGHCRQPTLTHSGALFVFPRPAGRMQVRRPARLTARSASAASARGPHAPRPGRPAPVISSTCPAAWCSSSSNPPTHDRARPRRRGSPAASATGDTPRRRPHRRSATRRDQFRVPVAPPSRRHGGHDQSPGAAARGRQGRARTWPARQTPHAAATASTAGRRRVPDRRRDLAARRLAQRARPRRTRSPRRRASAPARPVHPRPRPAPRPCRGRRCCNRRRPSRQQHGVRPADQPGSSGSARSSSGSTARLSGIVSDRPAQSGPSELQQAGQARLVAFDGLVRPAGQAELR